MNRETSIFVNPPKPKPKANIIFGQFTIYLEKKPNILLRMFLRALGLKANLIKEEEDK